MAKVRIEDESLDIRFSLLERLVLAERSRKVPLSEIDRVDAAPPLLDMMVHWSDQSGSWLCGVSSYDGQMIPSARNPHSTLAIETNGARPERIYVEVDDESPAQAAARIEQAVLETHARKSVIPEGAITPSLASTSFEDAEPLSLSMRAVRQVALMDALDLELEFEEEDEIRHRDPLMQGSLPPGPMPRAVVATEVRLDGDRDLSRVGSWLIGLGSLALLGGGVMIATGALPGLLAVGAGVTAALLGGFALAVVARQQD